jgi:histidinol-phosphate aminotransferase
MQTFPRPQTRLTDEAVKQKYGVEVVYHLGYNESPLGPSPQVVEAIQQAAGDLGYYPPMGDESLRRALAETVGRGLTEDHFFTGCSGYEVIELAARAYLEPGDVHIERSRDEVIISPPTFDAYRKIVKIQGATVVEVPLLRPEFVPDVDGILAAVTDHTRFVLVCNPNNPTGTMMNAAAMDRLVQELPDRVLLIADEVYFHFVTSTDFPDTLQYVLERKNIIIIHSFSKAYGLAGLRLGYGIARPDIANHIGGLHRGFHQNQLALAAGIAALKDQDHLERNVKTALEGKRWLGEQFNRLGLTCWPSETNYVVVETPQPAKDVAEFLLTYGVMVRPLKDDLDHCLRISITVPEGNQRFIEGLTAFLEK